MRPLEQVYTHPITEEVVSPRRYLSLSEAQRNHIASVRIVPSPLGSRTFGKIVVTWDSPQHRIAGLGNTTLGKRVR